MKRVLSVRFFKEKRGQSAMEFFILVGFLTFSFVVFLAIVNSNLTDKKIERQNQRLYDVAYTIKSEVDLAYNSIDGYSRSFEIPLKLGGMDYSVTVLGGLVAVKTDNGYYALALPLKNVTGDVFVGSNLIVKENGEVKFNP